MTRQIYMYINLVQKSQNLQVKLLDCSNESGAQWGSVGSLEVQCAMYIHPLFLTS